LGMKTIMPAFAGYVPPDFVNVYSKAKVSRLQKWAQGFDGTLFLDPLDDMFYQVGSQYLTTQQQLFGTDHLYNADPFNEEIPPTSDVKYLADVSKSVLKSIRGADPEAIWVMQGWFLVNDRAFWKPPQARAFFDAIPQESSIVLDLWGEVAPVWKVTESFYGHQFVWCMLHNFGGRPGLYGKLHTMLQDLVKTKLHNKNMIGIGLSPEAIENNPVAYELLLEMTWRSDVPDLTTFINQYTSRRYGVTADNVNKAWAYLRDGVYNCPTNQMGACGSLVAARPELDITYVNNAPVSLYFNKSELSLTWGLFLQSGDVLSKSPTYSYDLVDIGMHSLSTVALGMYYTLIDAYKSKNLTLFDDTATKYDQLMIDMDELTATNVNFLLGPWLESSKTWGMNEQERELMELNARLQITSWAPPELSDDLTQYAYKLWSGVMKDFYMPRWHVFYDFARNSMRDEKPIDTNQMKSKIISVEKEWISSRQKYSTQVSGDSVEVSKRLYNKYKTY